MTVPAIFGTALNSMSFMHPLTGDMHYAKLALVLIADILETHSKTVNYSAYT